MIRNVKLWTLLKALGYVFVFSLLFEILTYGFHSLILLKNANSLSNTSVNDYDFFCMSLSSFLSILVLIYFFSTNRRKKGIRYLKLDYDRKKFILLFIIALGILAISYCYGIVVEFLNRIFPILEQSVEEYESIFGDSSEKFAFAKYFYVIILAPILEELIYRGYLITELSQSFSKKTAIIVSAIVFGLYHINLYQSVFAMFVGVILGIIFVNTDSLLYSVITHMIYNALSVLSDQYIDNTPLYNVFLLATLIALFLTVPCLYRLKQDDKKIIS